MNTLLNHRLGRLGVGNYAVAFVARFASSSHKILSLFTSLLNFLKLQIVPLYLILSRRDEKIDYFYVF